MDKIAHIAASAGVYYGLNVLFDGFPPGGIANTIQVAGMSISPLVAESIGVGVAAGITDFFEETILSSLPSPLNQYVMFIPAATCGLVAYGVNKYSVNPGGFGGAMSFGQLSRGDGQKIALGAGAYYGGKMVQQMFFF